MCAGKCRLLQGGLLVAGAPHRFAEPLGAATNFAAAKLGVPHSDPRALQWNWFTASKVDQIMSSEIAELEQMMAAAAEAMDFEQARRLRDRINLLRGGATSLEAERADTSGLTRQRPGAMGIGTSQAKPVTPKNWRPPPKPDPMTSGHSSKKR